VPISTSKSESSLLFDDLLFLDLNCFLKASHFSHFLSCFFSYSFRFSGFAPRQSFCLCFGLGWLQYLHLLLPFLLPLPFLLFSGLLPYKAEPLSDFDFSLLRVSSVISTIRASSSSLVSLFLVFDRYRSAYIGYACDTLAINIVVCQFFGGSISRSANFLIFFLKASTNSSSKR
jgi:hypothetical protein